VIVDADKNELGIKIVYWGPGLCGKTSNMQHVWYRTPPESRSEMTSLATETQRTLFFSLLPRTIEPIDGRAVRVWLFCVPGAVFYDASRGLILKGVDGVVFVADTQAERIEANIESMQSLEHQMMETEKREIANVPLVIQYNKRDLPNVMPSADLDRALARTAVVRGGREPRHGRLRHAQVCHEPDPRIE
jgi:signal recognition particle receptor subunit beta